MAHDSWGARTFSANARAALELPRLRAQIEVYQAASLGTTSGSTTTQPPGLAIGELTSTWSMRSVSDAAIIERTPIACDTEMTSTSGESLAVASSRATDGYSSTRRASSASTGTTAIALSRMISTNVSLASTLEYGPNRESLTTLMGFGLRQLRRGGSQRGLSAV